MKSIIFWGLMAKVAWLMAQVGAGAASSLNGYQPQLPSQLIAK